MSEAAQKHTHYIGGVGRYDIFYDSCFGPRVSIKWAYGWGHLCMVTRDASETTDVDIYGFDTRDMSKTLNTDFNFDIYGFEELNRRLERRNGPPMTEEEYATMVAICELFGPIVAASVRKDNPVSLTTNTNQ
jgi:hypothetical protein